MISAFSLGPASEVTRFIHHQRNYAASTGRVKPEAFMPWHDGTTSVAEITGQAESEIWDMARFTLNAAVGRPQVRARADLGVSEIIGQGLRCLRDDAPFVGHSRILGWPTADHEQRARALALCAAARLAMPAAPITA